MRWNLAVAGLAASWGFISVIVAGVDLDARVLVEWRLALAALAVAALLLAARRAELLRPPPRAWRVLVVGALLAAHWLLFFETIKRASVAVAVLTVYTAPIFLAALAPMFLPEHRSRVALVALAPAAAGLVLMALAGDEGGAVAPAAVALGLGAAVTYAALVIATKRLTLSVEPATIAFWNYAAAAVCLLPFLGGGSRVLPHGAEVLWVAVLGIVFTALSGLLYIWLLRRVTAQAIGILAYLEPVSAALLAWAILGEELGAAVVVGGALVVAAGLLVVVAEPDEASPVEAPPVRPLPSAGAGE
ncbi:MAG TPA: DMT family transporter [Gaiellaceae bacterium]|nr:DMT family transporter [Gaiellaceae bacterium]